MKCRCPAAEPWLDKACFYSIYMIPSMVSLIMCKLRGQKLLVETPAVFKSPDMQAYIHQELHRPCKRWVMDVLNGSSEAEAVRLRTQEFVLLPDTERVNRYTPLCPLPDSKQPICSAQSPDHPPLSLRTRLLWDGRKQKVALPHPMRYWSTARYRQVRWCPGWPGQPCMQLDPTRAWPEQSVALEHVNWLAIATERGLHSLRDLRGHHLPMLRRLLDSCRKCIKKETGVPEEEIMAYVHYPPSVYQLHVHFAFPYAQYNHRDVFRIHSLNTVINNLEIDPDYYAKAVLQVSLGRNSTLHQIHASNHVRSHTAVLERRKSI